MKLRKFLKKKKKEIGIKLGNDETDPTNLGEDWNYRMFQAEYFYVHISGTGAEYIIRMI